MPPETFKKCQKCNIEKDISEFNPDEDRCHRCERMDRRMLFFSPMHEMIENAKKYKKSNN